MTQEQIANNLKEIINESLAGPAGDPDGSHLRSAAIAYKTLEGMGMMDDETREWRITLTGENSGEWNLLD